MKKISSLLKSRNYQDGDHFEIESKDTSGDNYGNCQQQGGVKFSKFTQGQMYVSK